MYNNDEILIYTEDKKNHYKTEFKDDFVNNITKLTGLEMISKMNFCDKARGIKLAGYAGFEGIGIKELEDVKLSMYDDEIYEEFVREKITATYNTKDTISIREVLDNFMIWMKHKQYEINKETIGKTRYSNIFSQEVVYFLTNFFDVSYNPNGRKRYNGIKSTGYFMGIKISAIKN